MATNTPTVPYRSSLMRVVIAHESPRPCFALADALRSRFVVRMAHALAELPDQTGFPDRVACVVCVSGPRLRARDVRDEAVRLGVARERIVVLALEDLEPIERALRTVREALGGIDPNTRLAG